MSAGLVFRDTAKADLASAADTVLAVIDAGGNSVSGEFRFLSQPLSKPSHLPPKIRQICRLADGLRPDGSAALNPHSKAAALGIIAEMADRIEALREDGFMVDVSAIGTAPFRQASDGQAFAEEIFAHTGIRMNVIDAAQEGRYAATGVLAHYPDISGIVVDTGGGSSEFVLLRDGEIAEMYNVPQLGMIPIGQAKNPEKMIKELLADVPKAFRKHGTLIATGGVHRTVMKSFARSHNTIISDRAPPTTVATDAYIEHARKLAHATPRSLAHEFHISEERAPQMAPARLLTEALCKRLDIETVILSRATVRDGVRAEMIERIEREGLAYGPPRRVRNAEDTGLSFKVA